VKNNGHDFLKMSKEEFEHCRLEMELLKRLANFAKDYKEKRLKPFSSFKSLSKMLKNYGFKSESIETIPLFFFQTEF
jgi:hypothetical protein